MAQLQVVGMSQTGVVQVLHVCKSEMNTNQCLQFGSTATRAPMLLTWPFELSPHEYT